ncbi:MAG: AmmeMemoRadiSam system protein A [Nitrospinaceae bacterium]
MESDVHPITDLARQAVRYYLDHGIPLPCQEPLCDDFKQPSGAFVSIKKGKKLRGCIGSLSPTHGNLAIEIIQNAISAATKDPRFYPVTREELDDLTFSVDVLTPLEKVDDFSQLDSKRYGVAVKSGDKQGILLPDLEGIDTVEEQLRICLKKAKIQENEPYEMYRFQVTRYK